MRNILQFSVKFSSGLVITRIPTAVTLTVMGLWKNVGIKELPSGVHQPRLVQLRQNSASNKKLVTTDAMDRLLLEKVFSHSLQKMRLNNFLSRCI